MKFNKFMFSKIFNDAEFMLIEKSWTEQHKYSRTPIL